MNKIYYQVGMLGVLLAFALPGFSKDHACQSPYEDADHNSLSFEDKFGDFADGSLRCNEKRNSARIVMQVNAYEQGGKAYGFRNLGTLTQDLEVTNGYDDWKIAVVVHSGGGDLVLKSTQEKPNPYEGLVSQYVADPNVDVYLCLNTAAAKGWTTDMIIPGVKFVPAGLSAIMDFQYEGYQYVQP